MWAGVEGGGEEGRSCCPLELPARTARSRLPLLLAPHAPHSPAYQFVGDTVLSDVVYQNFVYNIQAAGLNGRLNNRAGVGVTCVEIVLISIQHLGTHRSEDCDRLDGRGVVLHDEVEEGGDGGGLRMQEGVGSQ